MILAKKGNKNCMFLIIIIPVKVFEFFHFSHGVGGRKTLILVLACVWSSSVPPWPSQLSGPACADLCLSLSASHFPKKNYHDKIGGG